jgi:7-carboxy-7-deazaguanine synthase
LIEAAAGNADEARGAARLKISEIFHSIQGEALDSGWPTAFVRLTGCPLRCRYCDTAYAFTGGRWWTIDEIVAELDGLGARRVCVTGGEPLVQSRCKMLLSALCDAGYAVSLETSGALSIADVDSRVCRVLDVKTPGSGESSKNDWRNLAELRATDALKFVICGREDYEWSRAVLADNPAIPCTVFFSPSHNELGPGTLAEWILEDRLPVRLQVQLHKVLWGDVPGR